MIENKISLVQTSEILERDKDQRSTIDPDHIISLAKSIHSQSLIHTIILNKETGQLIAGKNRLEAFRWAKANGVECPHKSYEGWTKIPSRYAINVTPEEIKAIELEENIKRADLTWQDEAIAIRDYHEAQKSLDPEWSGLATSKALHLSTAYVSKRLQIAAELEAGNPKITSCTGVAAALNIVKRENERAVANEMELMQDTVAKPQSSPSMDDLDLNDVDAPALAPSTVEPVTPRIIPATESILNVDAIEWMTNYSGPKFNFLHADFPYGINHQKSEQGRSESHGAYDDSPEIFWALCASLANTCNNFMAHSSHIMFWYSFAYHEELMEFFRDMMPDWDVQSFPMIWHKSDNKGLLPDPNRYGRRTYEVALMLSRGDRKVVGPVALSYAAPTGQKEHLSMKPEPMLRHFFRMFVDEYVSMLDLTCGSGTSLRAAESLGAKHVLGLELDPENHANAVTALSRVRNLAALAEEL